MSRAWIQPLVALGVIGSALAAPAVARAQCANVGAASNEAKLLQLYTAPLAFGAMAQPARLSAGVVQFVLEYAQVPQADAGTQIVGCKIANERINANLAGYLPRPRLIIGLIGGMSAEIGYVPPVGISQATPNLFSTALSYTLKAGTFAGNNLRVQGRVHTTLGEIRGAITCPTDKLRPDAAAPCYGTSPSNDHYRPGTSGGELLIAVDAAGYGFYAGSGVNLISPELRADFTNGAGVHDETLVSLPQKKVYPILLGGTLQFTDQIGLIGQYYIVPNQTQLLRVGAAVRLH